MRSMFETILDNIETYPERTAIWTEEGSFTFQGLYDYSLRVAESLRSDGISKGDAVTIELPRCREYLGFMLGSWILGAVFVPSDNT